MKIIDGSVCAPKGFLAASAYAGIRKAKKEDLTLIVSEVPAIAVGTFTKNQVHAWCIAHNRVRLEKLQIDGVICNAGNANCSNGESGKQADLTMESEIAASLKTKLRREINLFSASTGVIGRQFPIDKVRQTIPTLIEALTNEVKGGVRAAESIMTTDLVSKSCAVEISLNGKPVRIGAIAKGSGMIAPNMATMLSFITTDALVDRVLLQRKLGEIVSRTFNRITVDGDTSTNDMVLLFANGQSEVSVSESQQDFWNALEFVCRDLAIKIARDGEGATKLITIKIKNPPKDAERIAHTIAESPLVKTACFGNDPNWGRIVAAAGRSGVSFDPKNLVVKLAGIEVFRSGEPTDFNESQVSNAMKTTDLEIELQFLGEKSPSIEEEMLFWTCDFSYDYVKINADYCT